MSDLKETASIMRQHINTILKERNDNHLEVFVQTPTLASNTENTRPTAVLSFDRLPAGTVQKVVGIPLFRHTVYEKQPEKLLLQVKVETDSSLDRLINQACGLPAGFRNPFDIVGPQRIDVLRLIFEEGSDTPQYEQQTLKRSELPFGEPKQKMVVRRQATVKDLEFISPFLTT